MNIMIEDKRRVSVYQIKNEVTGECYIGSSANGCMERWVYHRRRLNEGKHNKPFQDAWNKTDITDWSFRVVETDIPLEDRDIREAWWINKSGEYNIAKPSARQIKEEKIAKILQLIQDGHTYRVIARMENVALGTVAGYAKRYKLSI